MVSYRSFAATLLLFSVSSAGTGCGESEEPSHSVIELAVSLEKDSFAMSKNAKPIIVFVSQTGCEYCRLLRERVLHPLVRSGELQSKAVLREVSLDTGYELDDFYGQQVTGQTFAARYSVDVTPTLLFLDTDGKAIAEAIVGTGNIEFYEVYLNRSIDIATARQNLQL